MSAAVSSSDEMSDEGFVVDEAVAEAEDVGDDEPEDGESLGSRSSSSSSIEAKLYTSENRHRARSEQDQHEADAALLEECTTLIRALYSAIGPNLLSASHCAAIEQLYWLTQNLDPEEAPRAAKMLRYDDDNDNDNDSAPPSLSDHAVLLKLVPHIRALKVQQLQLPSEADKDHMRAMKQLIRERKQ
jgi:hypothetical protein